MTYYSILDFFVTDVGLDKVATLFQNAFDKKGDSFIIKVPDQELKKSIRVLKNVSMSTGRFIYELGLKFKPEEQEGKPKRIQSVKDAYELIFNQTKIIIDAASKLIGTDKPLEVIKDKTKDILKKAGDVKDKAMEFINDRIDVNESIDIIKAKAAHAKEAASKYARGFGNYMKSIIANAVDNIDNYEDNEINNEKDESSRENISRKQANANEGKNEDTEVNKEKENTFEDMKKNIIKEKNKFKENLKKSKEKLKKIFQKSIKDAPEE
jgi:glycogen debranching enzyme